MAVAWMLLAMVWPVGGQFADDGPAVLGVVGALDDVAIHEPVDQVAGGRQVVVESCGDFRDPHGAVVEQHVDDPSLEQGQVVLLPFFEERGVDPR